MGKKKKTNPVFFMLLFTGMFFFLFLVMQPLEVYSLRNEIAVLFPKGMIALKERNLLFIIQALMLLVIIPVYILTFIFSWKYRADNKKATYDPDLVDHKGAEIVWWGVPIVLVAIIGYITWVKTHELDPFKPIPSDNKTLRIEVVALQWKWLFIYPEQQIATVNYLQIPEKTPIHFEITSDAPMNSFWIPHLGGQIYAMPGMKTELHLIADEKGFFRGSSANISGEGFAGMYFTTRASSREDFEKWVTLVKETPKDLNWEVYGQLALPSQNVPVRLYNLKDPGLFNRIMMQFMMPQTVEPKE